MSDALEFPPAVIIGLWLNAAHSGSVSLSDAANAIETVTNQVEITVDNEWPDCAITSWADLVRQVAASRTPVAVGLPVDGDPAGVPAIVLAKIDRDSGVVAIDENLLLLRKSDESWILAAAKNMVIHYDLNQTRRSLTDQIAESTEQLAASDLVGNEAEILLALEAFRALHLPPHLSKRSTSALESAAKISIVARGAISNSAALHSPSIDRLRLHHLEELISKSRFVLQSVVVG